MNPPADPGRLAVGGAVGAAFLAAVFVSNIPQGVAGTASLRASGHSTGRIFAMWTGLTIACSVVVGLGLARRRSALQVARTAAEAPADLR